MHINKSSQILPIILLSIISCFLSGHAFGNSSSYYDNDGVTVFPIENNNIVMKKEIVKIQPVPKSTRWMASCEFTFYNKSETEELVTMGYPDWLDDSLLISFRADGFDKKVKKAISEYIDANAEIKKMADSWPAANYSRAYFKGYQEGKLPYVEEAWNVHDLKVLVDKAKVKTAHKPLNIKIKIEKRDQKHFAVFPEEPLGVFIWKVKFKPRETKTVNVTFSFGGLKDHLSGSQEVSYVLKTGALWADKIGEADIYWNFKGRNVDVSSIFPCEFKIEKKVIHWRFENFEPSDDISISVGYPIE